MRLHVVRPPDIRLESFAHSVSCETRTQSCTYVTVTFAENDVVKKRSVFLFSGCVVDFPGLCDLFDLVVSLHQVFERD